MHCQGTRPELNFIIPEHIQYDRTIVKLQNRENLLLLSTRQKQIYGNNLKTK